MSHAWEENRGISQSFGFNWQDTEENVVTSKELVDMLINIVARGGNLLLIVNPDGQGALPDIQVKRLKEIGQWLKINGEGIYYTRPYDVIAEESIRYTCSKDRRTVYAISLDWPGDRLELNTVRPADNSKIYLLGNDVPLNWEYKDGKTFIFIPEYLQDMEKRPCKYAYTFCIRQ
ncbi:alpha-L-fucosidase [Parabacteroides faecis]|uniref:alpha-L-fucosidase n=1 Tax=Parabacteroides faecis TaxID=1217282 RepID=UPI002165255C|nr:alpha-L-fucosidase [Parabacteroides faecis]MCS2891005.1 alpha-L-fucosidase [Parabacteroides faecis]